MPSSLRVAVLGAGGIGCYYGARLTLAGHRVTLVARGEHLQQLQSNGLWLEHPECQFKQAVDACSIEQLTAQYHPDEFDMLLLCVKATATAEVTKQLQHWFTHNASGCPVVSLQNGIDNEAQLAEGLGEQYVIGGLAVRIGGHIIGPGHVEATGPAQVIWGGWPNTEGAAAQRYGEALQAWTKAFNQAEIPTRLVPDIRRELWRKLVINNGVNPLSALTRLDTRALSHHPDFGEMVFQLMKEAAQAAEADGELLGTQDVQEMYELIRSFDPIKTSMLVDLEKGRPLEHEEISGAVLERSKRLGKEAPYTQSVMALLRHTLN